MLSFKEYLEERFVSVGFRGDQESNREKHRKEIHDILSKSYSHPEIGGYGGHKTGSKEESEAIHDDISKSKIKAVKRDGKITAVKLYKDQHGRKSIATGTNGEDRGKKDYAHIMKDDHKKERAWAEASGPAERGYHKFGYPKIPASRAKELTGKDVKLDPKDEHKYSRKIGGHEHTKTIYGFPKKS